MKHTAEEYEEKALRAIGTTQAGDYSKSSEPNIAQVWAILALAAATSKTGEPKN